MPEINSVISLSVCAVALFLYQEHNSSIQLTKKKDMTLIKTMKVMNIIENISMLSLKAFFQPSLKGKLDLILDAEERL